MNVCEILRELEASLLKNEVRKNASRVSELLADEFREFGRSGTVYTKANMLNVLQEEEEVRVAIQQFSCQLVNEGVALVTYRSERQESDGETTEALRSSLWVWRGERWQMVFHQGTPVSLAAATRAKV
jgi:hypothetical protein